MLWFLPLITIGGLWYPLLGYLVVAFMLFFLVLSYFKKRDWCWNLCPRGAFLDLVMPYATFNRIVPRIVTKQWFRWAVFFLFMVFIGSRLVQSNGNVWKIGSIFASMCLATTVVAAILAISMKPRAWCTFCPMGTLQEKIGSFKKRTPAQTA